MGGAEYTVKHHNNTVCGRQKGGTLLNALKIKCLGCGEWMFTSIFC